MLEFWPNYSSDTLMFKPGIPLRLSNSRDHAAELLYIHFNKLFVQQQKANLK